MQLLTTYSISEILIMGVCFILAIKGAWDLIEYFRNKYRDKFNKDYNKKKKEENLEEHYQDCAAKYALTKEWYSSLNKKIDNLTNTVNTKFTELDKRIDQLTESDMHDIKQSIVRDYHYFTEQKKWIDDFSLNTLELRYSDYKEEGGNSFIDSLMAELRQLPKSPPQ